MFRAADSISSAAPISQGRKMVSLPTNGKGKKILRSIRKTSARSAPPMQIACRWLDSADDFIDTRMASISSTKVDYGNARPRAGSALPRFDVAACETAARDDRRPIWVEDQGPSMFGRFNGS